MLPVPSLNALSRFGYAWMRFALGKSDVPKKLLIQKAIVWGSATTSYALVSPLISRSLLTDPDKKEKVEPPNLHDAALTGLYSIPLSFLAVWVIRPVGSWLQDPEGPLVRGLGLRGRVLGFVGSSLLDTGIAILAQMLYGSVYHWKKGVSLQTGALMGFSKGWPMAVIYHRWRNHPTFSVVLRQTCAFAIQTNAAVVNSLGTFNDGGELSSFKKAELVGVNLALFALFTVLPT